MDQGGNRFVSSFYFYLQIIAAKAISERKYFLWMLEIIASIEKFLIALLSYAVERLTNNYEFTGRLECLESGLSAHCLRMLCLLKMKGSDSQYKVQ